MKLSEWRMKMQDGMTSVMEKATRASAKLQEKITSASNKIATFGIDTNRLTGNLGSLRNSLESLKNQRDLIDINDITRLRAANSEINKLESSINKLEKVNGGVIKGWFKDAFSNFPGADFLANPVVAASIAVGALTSQAIGFETGMAKINATAQMSEAGIGQLQDRLLAMGAESSVDLNKIPDAFEKINSQVNDVPQSLSILESSLKGAKAGFADIDVVSGAVARTLSIVGKENTNAAEVVDTLMAAKRLGAGEFQDFANYVPGLIAAGKNLGIGFQDAAGLFAYMTAKGQDAANSTMLLQNVFTALSKSEIREGLKAQGISIYDNAGKLKDMGVIMNDVASKLTGMSDIEKTKWIEKIGLRDAQAKQGFSTLLSDVGLLNDIMSKTSNPVGETQKALDRTATTSQKLTAAWNRVAVMGIKLGGVILPIINFGLNAFSWFIDLISNHTKSFAIGVMGAVGALAYFKIAAWLSAGGLEAMAVGGWSAASGVFALSTALKSIGIGVIIMAVALLLEFIIELVQNCGELRAAFVATFDFIKALAKGFIEMLKGIIGGIANIWDGIKTGNFEKIKSGFSDVAGSIGKNVAGAWNEAGKGYDKYLSDFQKKKAENDRMMQGAKAGMPNMPAFDPSTQGAAGDMAGTGGMASSGEADTKIGKGLESVSGGGKETRNVIVNIDKLVESFNFTTNNPAMSAAEIKMMVEDALLRAVNGAEHSLAYSQ